MTPTFQAGAGCVVLLVSSSVEPGETGWIEQSTVELGAGARGCSELVLPLSPDAALGDERKAIQRLGDGIKRKLDDAFWEQSPRSLQGDGSVTVHLPDMLSGDRAIVRFERIWDRDAALTWAPPPGTRHAELSSDDARIEPSGRVAPGKRGFWVGNSEPTDFATLTAPGRDQAYANPHADRLPPSHEPEVERTLTLLVPPGDPQLTLYPGGGSKVQSRVHLTFEAEERDRSWLIETGPERTDLQVLVEPSDSAAEWVERADGVLITVYGSEAGAEVTARWVEPDAPTHGEPRRGESLEVRVEAGKIVTDRNGAWFLAGVNNRAIIPARSALVKALDRRFRAMSIPEPGLPNELRGLPADWSTAELLPEALRSRVEVMDLGQDPLWIRKLVKARKTGGLTRTEAAVMTWLYARQARIDADWALVRPAHTGPGGDASPAGYDHMVVRLQLGEEERWMDVACTECAPFELPPEVLGSDALGRGIERTPPPTEGRWTAVWGPDWVRWELVGPAALELRRWLADVEPDRVYPTLAARMAGPGAEIVEIVGLDEPGADIRVAARGGRGVRADPLALPLAPREAWIPWPGVRELLRAKPLDRPALELPGELLSYSREIGSDGAEIERLTVSSRAIPSAAIRAFDRARSAGPVSSDGANRGPQGSPDDPDPGQEQGGTEEPDPGQGGGDVDAGWVEGQEDPIDQDQQEEGPQGG